MEKEKPNQKWEKVSIKEIAIAFWIAVAIFTIIAIVISSKSEITTGSSLFTMLVMMAIILFLILFIWLFSYYLPKKSKEAEKNKEVEDKKRYIVKKPFSMDNTELKTKKRYRAYIPFLWGIVCLVIAFVAGGGIISILFGIIGGLLVIVFGILLQWTICINLIKAVFRSIKNLRKKTISPNFSLYCIKCGAKREKEAGFCSKCGTPFDVLAK